MTTLPAQKQQQQPGPQRELHPQPITERPERTGGRLQDRVVLISGGDSGIGRAIAVAAAREGASIAVAYLNEYEDARKTQELVEEKGRPYFSMAGDVGDETFCRRFIDETLAHYGGIDSTKGAIVAFTRALSNSIVDRGIRVNAIAPGPIWTPLIPASYSADEVSKFGADTPMKRPGQPYEVADAVIFLACDDASYISGQTLHVNGGQVVNS